MSGCVQADFGGHRDRFKPGQVLNMAFLEKLPLRFRRIYPSFRRICPEGVFVQVIGLFFLGGLWQKIRSVLGCFRLLALTCCQQCCGHEKDFGWSEGTYLTMPAPALRSNMWSCSTLERGFGLARSATLALESDPDMIAMQKELLEPWLDESV